MAAADVESSRVRELFNALRTGDRGVSFEPLARQLYFLQHRSFTLFDVLDAFRCSAGASERFLGYRDFQLALAKTARVKYEDSAPGGHAPLASRRPESDLIALLLQEMAAATALTTSRMDSLRCRLATASVLDTLRAHSAKLLQGFQMYGTVSSAGHSMTFDGFVDFLNAYFEYEDYFSYSDLAQMMAELQSVVSDGWQVDRSGGEAACAAGELSFMQFVELFCRVASAFHHETLQREGAQLRRAIETCRLEFSIELLLQHMDIKIIRDDECPASTLPRASSGSGADVEETGGVQVSAPVADSDTQIDLPEREPENAKRSSTTKEIARLLAGFEAAKKKPSRSPSVSRFLPSAHPSPKRSVLFSRLPPRRSSATRPPPAVAPVKGLQSLSLLEHATFNHDEPSVKHSPRARPPQVVMIREIVSPPPMPASVLHLVESAIKYQNAGQFNMALSTLDTCRAQLTDLGGDSTDSGELQVFSSLLTASVFDSAHKDVQALDKYVEALKAAETLPPDHPARLLVRSCMACTLFYMGELSLAKQAHQQVLQARKATALTATSRGAAGDGGESDAVAEIDLATAMNNVACCLSQEERGEGSTEYSPLEEAFLLFKEAKRIYTDAFGPSHPRVELLQRNVEHARVAQVTVVTDARGALERGEYAHVIPGSVFQIRALEAVKSLPQVKKGKKGGKKKGGKKKSK